MLANRNFVSCALLFALAITGCSQAKKRNTPVLSELEGKKVALVKIEGTSTARSVVEVALVNELIERGSFELIPKAKLEKLKADANIDEVDDAAKRAGADYALRCVVDKFETDVDDSYITEQAEDSQLLAERGEEARSEKRVIKVKTLTGHVKYKLSFKDLKSGQIETGIAEESEQVNSEERTKASRLPPRLRFLEELSKRAFKRFFEQYN